jgi:hypothetical protein
MISYLLSAPFLRPHYLPTHYYKRSLGKYILSLYAISGPLLRNGRAHLWLGDGHTVGKLHFDPYDNLLIQLEGNKMFLLIDPVKNERLYEGHMREAEIEVEVEVNDTDRIGSAAAGANRNNDISSSSTSTSSTSTSATPSYSEVKVGSFRKYRLSESTSMVHSPVSLHNPDLDRYPLAAELAVNEDDGGRINSLTNDDYSSTAFY